MSTEGGYRRDARFKRPEDDARIWRYVDFAKLVDLLDTGTLFFARADQMPDPWEGRLTFFLDPDAEITRMRVEHPEILEEMRLTVGPDGTELDPVSAMRLAVRAQQKIYRLGVHLSCWYVAEHESAAMWDLYAGRDGRGVAIQSTFSRFEAALPSAYERAIYAGLVRYVDYRASDVDVADSLEGFLTKRRSFEHERELRAVADARDHRAIEHWVPPRELGLSVPIDTELLIESVYVSPVAPPWFASLVERTVRRYGAPADIIQSDLLNGPIE